ncbi:MAG TPA: protein kinase [Polyangiaceae bacterium]|nr:protein kinase [Polyangiaceae bacterium]
MTAQREFSDGELIPGTRYRVVGLIGSGGMGSVYEVEHVELGKRFVLKALLRSLTNRDDLVHRLRNEWRALGKLEHRNIVSVTDAGITTTGLPYFVMERLKGETLAARLRRERRVPVRDAITIAADVLEGLSAAHRIGIVHRDVKPPNVFLVAKRPAKLLDFGIAKVLDPKASQITGRGIAIGTPRYMAPEQATGETVDARTDLYAVGLILFEMISGAGPFDGARDANEVFLAHIAKTAPALTSIAPFAPSALDPWVARLLAKKPEHRPDDAEAVARALRALVTELKVTSPPPALKDSDDPTLSGGPFDTLEAARTIPSDPPAPEGGVTRTGIGPVLGAPSSPWHLEELQNSKTLRLDALTAEGEAATRTSAPVAAPDTPIPVTETPSPATAVERRWAWASLVAAAIAAIVAGIAISMQHAHAAKGADATAARPPTAAATPHAAKTAKAPEPAKEAVAQSGAGPQVEPPAADTTAQAPQSTLLYKEGAKKDAPVGPLPARSQVSPPSSAVHPQRPATKSHFSEPKAPSGPELPGSGL